MNKGKKIGLAIVGVVAAVGATIGAKRFLKTDKGKKFKKDVSKKVDDLKSKVKK